MGKIFGDEYNKSNLRNNVNGPNSNSSFRFHKIPTKWQFNKANNFLKKYKSFESKKIGIDYNVLPKYFIQVFYNGINISKYLTFCKEEKLQIATKLIEASINNEQFFTPLFDFYFNKNFNYCSIRAFEAIISEVYNKKSRDEYCLDEKLFENVEIKF